MLPLVYTPAWLAASAILVVAMIYGSLGTGSSLPSPAVEPPPQMVVPAEPAGPTPEQVEPGFPAAFQLFLLLQALQIFAFPALGIVGHGCDSLLGLYQHRRWRAAE